MITVTQEFKDALKASIKTVSGYLELSDGTQILPGEELQSYTVQSTGGFLRTAMSKLTVKLLGEHELANELIDVYYGVEYGGSMNYVLKGKFNITEVVYQKDTNTTTLTGYDNMIKFTTDYVTVGTYPTTLYDYLQAVSSLAGIALENSTIFNGGLTLTEDYYQNIDEYTVRDVLEDICEASASYALINANGNLELRQITNTEDVIGYDQLLQYEIGDYWGGINSLVLSRQPQNDDVFYRDDVDINTPTNRNLLDFNKFSVGYKAEDS